MKRFICKNSMEMVIHLKKLQNNILYVTKCKKKEAHFVAHKIKYF